MFFGADGGMLKALPVGAYLVGQHPPLGGNALACRAWMELLGTASAVSFTLVETLGQYVPEMIRNGSLEAVSVGELVGLQLLFPRILGSVAGHMAYSGYLGYFIGLC